MALWPDQDNVVTDDNIDDLDGIAAILHRARPRWMRSAACAGMDPSVFVPTSKPGAAVAFTICGRCQVRDACLEWAIDVGDFTAVLGGTDGPARRRIATQRAREISDATFVPRMTDGTEPETGDKLLPVSGASEEMEVTP